MKRFSIVSMVLVLLITLSTLANAGEWRIPLGVTYINGTGDIHDQLEDNLEAEGHDTDTVKGFPVGLSVQPYYEFDSGLGLGIGFGPIIWVFGDADFFDLPVNLCLRYAILPDAKVTPYIRTGAAYHIIAGDYDEGSEIGFIGGIGVEFMRDRAVSLGIEVGYDSSTIELEDYTGANADGIEEITPVGFYASIFAVF